MKIITRKIIEVQPTKHVRFEVLYIFCRYRVNTTLSSRVSHLNPKWNDEKPDQWVSDQNLNCLKFFLTSKSETFYSYCEFFSK